MEMPVDKIPKWFTVEFCPSHLRPQEMEWVAHEGNLPDSSRQLSRKRKFLHRVRTITRESAILDVRRIHAAKQLEATLKRTP